MIRHLLLVLVPAALAAACSNEAAAPASVAGADSGPESITFADLSLAGLDRESLLGAYSGEAVLDDAPELPERIRRLDGRSVRLRGYVIPHAIEGMEVSEFMLVRDLADCCFGGSPGPDEWIAVKMAPGTSAEYGRFTPTFVTGTLAVGGDRGDLRWTPGIFRMTGTEAEFDL